ARGGRGGRVAAVGGGGGALRSLRGGAVRGCDPLLFREVSSGRVPPASEWDPERPGQPRAGRRHEGVERTGGRRPNQGVELHPASGLQPLAGGGRTKRWSSPPRPRTSGVRASESRPAAQLPGSAPDLQPLQGELCPKASTVLLCRT